jgi:hypothetical protein
MKFKVLIAFQNSEESGQTNLASRVPRSRLEEHRFKSGARNQFRLLYTINGLRRRQWIRACRASNYRHAFLPMTLIGGAAEYQGAFPYQDTKKCDHP